MRVETFCTCRNHYSKQQGISLVKWRFSIRIRFYFILVIPTFLRYMAWNVANANLQISKKKSHEEFISLRNNSIAYVYMGKQIANTIGIILFSRKLIFHIPYSFVLTDYLKEIALLFEWILSTLTRIYTQFKCQI